MEMVIGIVLGIVFGVIAGIAFTLATIADSNTVGGDKGRAGHFIYDSEVVFHEKINK